MHDKLFVEIELEEASVGRVHYWNPLDPTHPFYKSTKARVDNEEVQVYEYQLKPKGELG